MRLNINGDTMNTRERLIAAGKIRPANTTAECTLREMLIGAGRVRPQGLFVEPNAPLAAVMRAFMIRVTGR